MPKIIVGVDAIIEKDRKILITQRSKKDKSSPEFWDFPGGKIDFGENLIEALKREIKEEVGLDVDVLIPIDAFGKLIEDEHVIVVTFLCNYKSGEVKLGKEHQSFKWIDPKKVPDIEDLTPFLEHAIYPYLEFISV